MVQMTKYSDPQMWVTDKFTITTIFKGSTISFKYNESYDMKKLEIILRHAMPYKERSLHNVFDSIQVRAINKDFQHVLLKKQNSLQTNGETKISRGAKKKG